MYFHCYFKMENRKGGGGSYMKFPPWWVWIFSGITDRAWNCDSLVANVTKNWALATKFPELVASWRLAFCQHKTKRCFLWARKQLFANLTNKNNKETDHFEEVFLAKQPPNITKTTLFVCKHFLPSRHLTCLLVTGLDTGLYSTSSVQFSIVQSTTWLLSYEHFHKHKDNIHAFHAKFNGKTVLNEEIFVKEWQKKIKHVNWPAELMCIL